MHALQRKNKAQRLLYSELFLCLVHEQLNTSCVYSEHDKTDFLSGYLVSRSPSTRQLKKCDWLADFDIKSGPTQQLFHRILNEFSFQGTTRVLDMICFL